MALKTLMLRKKIADAKAELEAVRAKDEEFVTREAELTTAIAEATTEEEKRAVEEAIAAYDGDKTAHEEQKSALERTVGELEQELDSIESENEKPAAEPPGERKEDKHMNTRTQFFGMTIEQRDAFMARDDVKEFLERTRTIGAEKRAISGGELLIPDVMLELIHSEILRTSRLLNYVRTVPVSGNSRQRIAGAVPEAVWTEMCATLNELVISFNEVEVDGYKVGGYIPVCNALLADTDIALATELIAMLGAAIGKALDKAILFGSGVKMPIGIATRLAQTSQPASWGANAPAWTDLHTSNVIKLNIDSYASEQFFRELIAALAVARPVSSAEGLFWVMNRKTHMKVMAKALAYNSAAALTAGISNSFPIIGGDIIEIEDGRLADNEIIGGYGKNYLLAERSGASFASSDQPLFIQDQTVYKGTARYDGMPVFGEAFVLVNFANTDPTTSQPFASDYANDGLNILTVVAAAHGTTAGKTVLTVTNTVAQSNAVLKYKLRADVNAISAGDKLGSGWESLTSGSTGITAAAGTIIAVVELDANNRVVSVGSVASVPKAS